MPAGEFLGLTMRQAAAIWRRHRMAHGILDADQAPAGFWPTNNEEQQRAALAVWTRAASGVKGK